MSDRYERRFTADELQVRAVGDGDSGKTTIAGRAIVYNAWTQIGPSSWGWKERIAPGAFSASLQNKNIYASFNHSYDNLLGRLANGTLRLVDSEKGLDYEIDPNLETEIGRQVLAYVGRRDVTGSSFAFSVDEYSIERAKKKTDMDRITIVKGEMFELGPVTNPAYSQTSAKLRSAVDSYREQSQAWAERRAELLRRVTS